MNRLSKALQKIGLLRSFMTIDDLDTRGNPSLSTPIQRNLREKVKIGIIDDEAFAPGKNLRNHGYEIRELDDVKSVSEVSGYPIILCDLMGVGMFLDEELQGATLIREIRKNYPATLVVAYSGASQSSKPVRRAKQFADKMIAKDADMETWTKQLDQLIVDAIDPKKTWSRIKLSLVEQSMDTKLLLEFEDQFVRAVQADDPSAFVALLNNRTLTESTSSILHGLISSTIFSLLTGSP